MLDKGTMIFNPSRELELTLGGLATSDDEIQKNRNRLKRVLRAIWKGTIYMFAHEDGTVDAMQKRLPKIAPATILRDVKGGIEDCDEDGTISEDAQTRELAVRGELLGIKPEQLLPISKVYDFTLIREVVAELKAQNWKPAR
jgi:ABC-type nitrate/sulfonate/bicarbonate transport system substrate-binding protein